MKLSEAIRLGAMVHPQAFGMLIVRDGSTTIGTCALGAAREAGYVLRGLISTPYEGCHLCGYVSENLFSAIGHLNDWHRCSREQIAEWVETIEPREIPDAGIATSDVRGTTDVDQPVLSIRET